jgi:threonine/homoserine/homoserine lactone efflux protein
MIVKYAGAAYLVYLGARKLLEHDEPGTAVPPARSRVYVRGVLVQLLNPKIAIFFLAFLPQFVDAAQGPIAPQILVPGTIFTVLALLSDSAYVLLAGAVGGWLRKGRHAGRRLAKLSGGIYIGLGVGAALSGSSHARPSPPG